MIDKEEFIMFFRRNLFVFTMIGLGMGVISLFLTIIFPATDMQSAELISSSWPQIMKDLFGDPLNAFTSIYGWIHLEVFHITFWLFFGVLASILGSRIVAYEIENKTMDILLSTPITRVQLILSRFTALMFILFVSIIPTVIGCGIGIIISGYSLNWSVLIVTSIIGFLLSLSFASIVLAVSIFIPHQIFSIFFSLGFLGLMFLYSESLVKLVPGLEKIPFMSLFHFYNTDKLLIHNSFSITDPIVLFTVTVVFLLVSIVAFLRKDIFI
jgi:ABC-2 type transport system permease protein